MTTKEELLSRRTLKAKRRGVLAELKIMAFRVRYLEEWLGLLNAMLVRHRSERPKL